MHQVETPGEAREDSELILSKQMLAYYLSFYKENVLMCCYIIK